MIEGLILLIVGLGAFTAFVVGAALLLMWYRAGQMDEHDQPVIYGNMVQCPNCEWMNPLDTAVCLKCREPLTLPPGYRPTLPVTPPPVSFAQGQNAPTAFNPPPPAGATVRSPYAPPPAAPQPGMAEGTIRAQAPAVPTTEDRGAAAATVDAGASGGAWLQATAGDMKGQRVNIGQTDTLFGRSTKCDVQIPDKKVSRKHFVIRYAQGGYFLQDQGSTGGTLVNGEPVEARRLVEGDRIDLGDTTLVFHLK